MVAKSMACDHQGRGWMVTIASMNAFDGSQCWSCPIMGVEDVVVDEANNIWAGSLFDDGLTHIAEEGSY